MNGTNLSSHQDRLKIVFRLKLELLRDILLGRYRVSESDFKSLVSDLKEILHTSETLEYTRYLR
jgi:hypothetical protein